MTTTYSRALPEAMGYTVKMDEPAGYGVTRMLIRRESMMANSHFVWNPRDDSAQCFEVLAWPLKRNCVTFHGMPHCIAKGTICVEGPVDDDGEISEHDGTPAGIRAAIVEAAERVVKELGRG